jgi:hypothetical protein
MLGALTQLPCRKVGAKKLWANVMQAHGLYRIYGIAIPTVMNHYCGFGKAIGIIDA